MQGKGEAPKEPLNWTIGWARGLERPSGGNRSLLVQLYPGVHQTHLQEVATSKAGALSRVSEGLDQKPKSSRPRVWKGALRGLVGKGKLVISRRRGEGPKEDFIDTEITHPVSS